MTNHQTEEFEIRRISNSGYAWGESLDSELTEVCLGPLKSDVGDTITAAPISDDRPPEDIAVCVDDSKWMGEYVGSMAGMCSEETEDQVVELLREFESITPIKTKDFLLGESQLKLNGTYVTEVIYFSTSGLAWGSNIDEGDGMILLGSVDVSEGENVEVILVETRQQSPDEVGICLSTDLWKSDYKEQIIGTFASENKSTATNIVNRVERLDTLERESGTSDTQEDDDLSSDNSNSGNGDNTTSQSTETDPTSLQEEEKDDQETIDNNIEEDSPEPPSGLQNLREKANREATEVVEETTVSPSSTKQEYNRSTAVKEYVKARANGVCEGCGDPAPFKSKTGEPYLHAHHVHELSEGGSDTNDSVIALCPNSHYQVHHGAGGEEYNQKLIEKLDELEESK